MSDLCQLSVSYKSVKQECLTRVSSKKCLTRVSSKSALQQCQVRVSCRSVKQDKTYKRAK